MSKSIMQKDKDYCFICGQPRTWDNPLEEHHVIFGIGRRKLSEKYGLKVYLCSKTCHRSGQNAPHSNGNVRQILSKIAQACFEETHGTKEFFYHTFGKYYLEDEERVKGKYKIDCHKFGRQETVQSRFLL